MSKISASLVSELRVKTGAGMMDCKRALTESDGDFDIAIDWLRKQGLSAARKKSDRVATDGLIGVAVSGHKGAIVEVNAETDFVARNELFQAFVSDLAALALSGEHNDLASLLSASYKAGSDNVEAALTGLIATIGENIQLRRVDFLSVNDGVVGYYVHSAVGAGLGKIGVLIGLRGGDDALGKNLAMHIAASNPRFLAIGDVDESTLSSEREILAEQARASGKPAEVVEKMVEGRLRKFYQESVLLEQLYIIDGESTVKNIVGDGEIVDFVRFELGEGLEKREDDFAAEVAATAGV